MINDQRQLLGLKVRDRVTGFEGVATSVTFDLFGCVQTFVIPPVNQDGKIPHGAWFDAHRLETLSSNPVMTPPTFAEAGPKGGQVLPAPSR